MTTNSVAQHGATHVSTNGVAHMGILQGRVRQHQTPQSIGANICSLFGQSGENLPLAYPADQAESLCRPLARRDFKMARPARVFIRWRKPCFLARRRLFGWKVRFTHASSVRCREDLDNSGRTTYWAERWDYNGKNSTGKTRFLCLWKTCYLRFPRLVSAGVSTPCGQCCGRHMTRVPLVGNA